MDAAYLRSDWHMADVGTGHSHIIIAEVVPYKHISFLLQRVINVDPHHVFLHRQVI
jgi:hypothetical protein